MSKNKKLEGVFFENIELNDEGLFEWKKFPKLKHPGRIDNMSHMRELMLVNKYLFTGFALGVNYVLDRNFSVSHTIALGKDDPMMAVTNQEEPDRASYTLVGQYVGKNYLMNGTFSMTGINQSVFQYKKGGFGIVVQGQALGENFAFDMDCYYGLHDSLLEGKLQSKEAGLAFTQAITKNLAFGAEYMIGNGYVYNKLIFRHKDKKARTKKTVSFTRGSNKNEVRLYYSKKVTKNLEFLSAYRITKKKNFNSNWFFGYMSKSNRVMIKSLMDGTGNISTLVEMPFTQVSTASICANINYRLNSYDFGFGINVMV